jgi:probable HAF family extracellular repeat protein
MAGVTGEGPRELRAWASHLGTFGERHWPDSVSIARGVNAHGLVVGNVLFDAGEFNLSRAFFVAAGAPARFLVPPQGGTTFTTGVNDAGDIIFNATPLGAGPDETQAWCMRHGAYTPIPGFNGAHSWATALSSKGLVVGHARDAAGTTRAFLWQEGHTTDLSMGGACTSEALGVNDHRTVVGRLTDSAGERRAFRWTPEDGLVRLEDLIDDRADWHIEEAVAVNASGTIVGHGLYRGQPRGFQLNPVTA